MEEFEIKFLEVDVPELEKKLLAIGAKKVGKYNYRRAMFDYPDWRLDKEHAWLRLRTDGKETTLTYKQRIGVRSKDGSIPDEGMKETEITVSDYQKTFQIMKSVGFIIKLEVESRRIRYEKDKVVFDIDFYPKIPPFVEIEADSLASVKATAWSLGFNPGEGLICSPTQVYNKYGIHLDEYSSITFEKFVKK